MKTAQVRVASAAPSSSSIGAFFGNLFGFKRDDANANVRENSVTQPGKAKSQAAPNAPKGTPEAKRATDSKKLSTNTQTPLSQQELSAEPPADAGGARTTNLLIGAVPTVPAGNFESRLSRAQGSSDRPP